MTRYFYLTTSLMWLALCSRTDAQPLRGVPLDDIAHELASMPRQAFGKSFVNVSQRIANRFSTHGLEPIGTGAMGINQYIQAFGSYKAATVDEASGQVLPGLSYNVIGVRRGTGHYKGAIVVSAHHDAVDGTDGAHDNASGVMGMLLMSETLARWERNTGKKLDRDIIFVATGAEEHGQLGMWALLKKFEQDGQTIAAHINLDMIGRGSMDNMPVYGGIAQADSNQNSVYKHAMAIKPKGRKMARLVNGAVGVLRGQALLTRGDAWPPVLSGNPNALMYLGDMVDYHLPTDTFEKLDHRLIQGVSRQALRVLVNMANDPALPQAPQQSQEQRQLLHAQFPAMFHSTQQVAPGWDVAPQPIIDMEPESGAPHIDYRWPENKAPKDIRQPFWQAFFYTYKAPNKKRANIAIQQANQALAALVDSEIDALQQDIQYWQALNIPPQLIALHQYGVSQSLKKPGTLQIGAEIVSHEDLIHKLQRIKEGGIEHYLELVYQNYAGTSELTWLYKRLGGEENISALNLNHPVYWK